MSISEAIVAEFNAEAANTRKLLEAVPGDQLAWKPHEKSMSLGQLASHIAETPSWAPSMMEPELDFGAMSESYKPFMAGSGEELMEAFEKHVKGFEETVTGKDDAFLAETWTMRSGDEVLMQMPRHVALKSISINHVIHHRGQLTVYLRLLGLPVPGTYGPTADEPGTF